MQTFVTRSTKMTLKISFLNSLLFLWESQILPSRESTSEINWKHNTILFKAFLPRAHEPLYKKKLDKLVQVGFFFELTRCSEWMAGTFIVPKKDGSARLVSNFQGLNRNIKQKVYSMPKIGNILAWRTAYAFFILMQYYTFWLDEESKDLCTMVTPFGLYQYCRLPMGVHTALYIAQEVMENIFQQLMNEIEVYISSITVFSNFWEDHSMLLQKVLQKLRDNGFTMNLAKCKWVGVRNRLPWPLADTSIAGIKPWN